MKAKEGISFQYFKTSLEWITRSPKISLFFLWLNHLNIYSNAILSVASLKNKEFILSDDILFYISPYNIFKKYSDNSETIYLSFIIISVVLYLIYIFLFLYIIRTIKSNHNKCFQLLRFIFVNVYEFIFFRIFPIFIFDSICYFIVSRVSWLLTDDNILNLVYICFLILFCLLYLFWILSHYSSYVVWSNFSNFNSKFKGFPFTQGFGLLYDIYVLWWGVLIPINRNIILVFGENLHEYRVSSFLQFLNCILIFSSIVFSLKLFYDLCLNRNNFLFYQISTANVFRIYLILITGLTCTLRLWIKNDFNCLLYSVLILAAILLGLLLCLELKAFLFRRMWQSKNLFGVLYFIISNEIEDNQVMAEWITHHRLTCYENNCALCVKICQLIHDNDENEKEKMSHSKELKTKMGKKRTSHPNLKEEANPIKRVMSDTLSNDDEATSNEPTPDQSLDGNCFVNMKFQEFFDIWLSSFKNQILKTKHLYNSSQNTTYLEFYELIHNILSDQKQHIIFYITFDKAWQKFENLDKCIWYNIIVLFEYANEDSEDFMKSYNNFIDIDYLITFWNKYLISWNKFMKYDLKSPQNVIHIAEEFNNLNKNEIVSDFLTTHNNEYDYQLIILRYIYETWTKSPLKGQADFFDISMFNDFTDYHFKNDRIIWIKYFIQGGTTTILKGGGEIKNWINKSFDELFPVPLKNEGKAKFIEWIHKNSFHDPNNVFEFVINNPNMDSFDFLESFKMKFVLYPSLETHEMIIAGNFTSSSENLLVFQLKDTRNIWCSYSKSLVKFFGFPPIMFSELLNNGKYITFSQIFSKKKNENQKSSFNFCYQSYVAKWTEIFDDIKEDECFWEGMNNIKNLKGNLDNIEFRFLKKFVIEVYNTTYTIYYVYENSTKVCDDNINQTRITEESKEWLNANTIGYNYNNNFDSVSVSCTSVTSSKGSNYGMKVSVKKIAHIEKAGVRNINIFVRIISGFSLGWVIISWIFLIWEIEAVNKFEQLFFLFQSFKYNKRNIEIQPWRWFANLCITTDDTCEVHFKRYSEEMREKNPTDKNIPYISEEAYLEFISWTDSLHEKFWTLQNQIFEINNPELNQLLVFQSTSIEFGSDQNLQNELRRVNMTIFNAINLYQNHLAQISNSDALNKTPISFFNLDFNKFSIDSSSLDASKLSSIQKNIYQVIINYPYLHRSILDCQAIISTCFDQFLKNIENLLFIFSAVIVALQSILLWICYRFIQNYKTVMHNNYVKVIEIVTSNSYINHINEWITNLQTLIKWYESKPSELSKKITNDKDKYKSLKRKEYQQMKKGLVTASPVIIKDKSIYNPIVAPYQTTLLSTFIMFYIFFVTIFISIYTSLDKLKGIISFTNINAQIDNDIYDNWNANQMLFLTNITTYDISFIINQNNSLDYIQAGITDHYNQIKAFERFIESNDNYDSMSSWIDMSCENLYKLDDNILKSVGEKYGYDSNAYMEWLCNIDQIMSFKDSLLLQKEILYLMEKLNEFPINVNWEDKIKYLKHDEIYKLYTLLMGNNRIIRTYLNEIHLDGKAKKFQKNSK